MRLIDADKIHRSRAKITEGSKSFYKEWFSASAIDNAPTVEAITIEWLKRYELAKGQEVRLQDAINEWEKENERP